MNRFTMFMLIVQEKHQATESLVHSEGAKDIKGREQG